MELLRIENLYKNYNKVTALSNINLSINESEVVSIIGPSGSGKSTLLRMISNLETTDKGTIMINNDYLLKNGKYLKDSNKVIKNLGMIFQDYSLFDNLNVKDNIEISPKLIFKINNEELTKLSQKLLKQVGLLDKLLCYPSQLSGGQKQRIAIARSLAMMPKLLLIDEPTSALDVESIENLVNIIKDLKRENITILIVTHDIEFAKKVSSRLIFMEDAEILFDTKIENINEVNHERFLKFINK